MEFIKQCSLHFTVCSNVHLTSLHCLLDWDIQRGSVAPVYICADISSKNRLEERILLRRLCKICDRIKTAVSIQKLTKLLQDKQDLDLHLLKTTRQWIFWRKIRQSSKSNLIQKHTFLLQGPNRNLMPEFGPLLTPRLARLTIPPSLQHLCSALSTSLCLWSLEKIGKWKILENSLIFQNLLLHLQLHPCQTSRVPV